jgi:hypothetical protein
MNLASLLNTNASDIKRPIPFNDGTYFGTIKSYKFIESALKKTPGVEYTVELSHAHDDTDLTGYDENNEEVQLNPAGKSFRTTYYLTENSLFMLNDLLKALGIEVSGRTLGELIPQAVGQPVMVDLVKSPNKDNTGFFNQINKIAPVEG